MSMQNISVLLKCTLFFFFSGNICHVWPKFRSVLVPVPLPLPMHLLFAGGKKSPFYCASLVLPFHRTLSMGWSAAAASCLPPACTSAGSSTLSQCLRVDFAPPQHEGTGHCDCSLDLVQAMVRYSDASHEPRLCLQRGEGNLLPLRLKLFLHAWGLSLAEKKETNPISFNISIIQPKLILIFSFDSFVVFISRDFCRLPSILQCA